MFLWGALRSARVIPLVALAVLPLANAATAEALRERGIVRRVLDYSAGLRRIDRRVTGGVFSVVAVALMLIAMRALPIGFAASRYPVHAADAIPANARLFAPDAYGGYLIYRFNGNPKVYFDGRSDFYGVEFMKQYFTLVTARPGWQEIVRSFGFTHALVPNDSTLRAALEQAGWTRISSDQVATLLEAH